MRAHDWSRSPLGVPETWPASLRTVAELMLDSGFPMFTAWGPELGFLYNDAYACILGAKHPDALGRRFEDVWPEIWSDILPMVEAAMAGHATYFENLPLVMKRKGYDEQTWFTFSYSPVRDESGTVAGMFCACTETTDAVMAETALRESEDQFRAFAQAVPNHVWASRPDGHLYWFNQQVYAYTGLAEGALDGPAGWGDVVHPDDLPTAGETWARSLASGKTYHMEFRIRRGDGEWRWFVVRAEAVRDDSGAIIRWVGANIDIDDIRRQGVEMASLNAQLADLLAGSKAERDRLWTLSQDMLARADYAGGLLAVNPAWTKVLGWTEHELLTNPYADIINPENIAATTAALMEMGETGQPTRFENRILSKDGRWTSIGWTVAPEPDGIHFIAVGRDLSEDKAREQLLAQAQEALRQSQKMEAVGQLTGGIAHDFNNLLAGISGSLELLEKRLDEGRLTGIARYITAAQASADRAATLTQRLLAFSRRQTLDPRAVDVNRLVAEMEDLIRRTVGPTIEVEFRPEAELWSTKIDVSQLENALLNLSINARDAMAPNGGRLTIETANKVLDGTAATERDLTAGEYVYLCVGDTGTGMPPEIIEKAFDPFFTTKPMGQGTGLGLSMIHGFVRQSGGQVRIKSVVGEGTRMCLYLPRHAGPLDTPVEPAAPRDNQAGHGETVLVIDDEPAIRMLVVEMLTDSGYRALEAEDGPGGLAILRSDAVIDLLITDVGLPGGLNGRQVADAARESRPGLKVLFVTGYAENALVGNGHLDDGMEILTKPFVLADLGDRIRKMLETRPAPEFTPH
jgi:PAS domain S-box-containing protein